MRKIFVILLIGFIVFSCKKETTEMRLPDFESPLITGFILTDVSGTVFNTIGTPNDFRGQPVVFSIYPNPTSDFLHVSISSLDISGARLWITQGNFQNSQDNQSISGGITAMVVGGVPLIEVSNVNGGQNFMLNFQSLPAGYYRVYLQNGNDLYWHNIIVSRSYNGK